MPTTFDFVPDEAVTNEFDFQPEEDSRAKRREALQLESEDLRNQALAGRISEGVIDAATVGAGWVAKEMNPLRIILNAPINIGKATGVLPADYPTPYEYLQDSARNAISPEKATAIIHEPIPGFKPFERETWQKVIPERLLPTREEFEGLEASAGKTLSGLSNPITVGTAMTGKPALNLFKTEMIAAIPETVKRMEEAAARGDTRAVGEATGDLFAQTVGPLAIRKGEATADIKAREAAGLGPSRIAPKLAPADVPGSVLNVLQPPTAQPTPKQAMISERATPEQRAAQLREANAETAITKGEPNAIQPESAQLLRDVRQEPIQGAGEVPAAVSGEQVNARGSEIAAAPDQPARAPEGVAEEASLPITPELLEKELGVRFAGERTTERGTELSLETKNAEGKPGTNFIIKKGATLEEAKAKYEELRKRYEGDPDQPAPLKTGQPVPQTRTLKEFQGLAKDVRAKLESGKAGEAGFVNLDVLKQIVDFGKTVYQKGMAFASWSVEMIKHLGTKAADYLHRVWDDIRGNNGIEPTAIQTLISKKELPTIQQFLDMTPEQFNQWKAGAKIWDDKSMKELAGTLDRDQTHQIAAQYENLKAKSRAAVAKASEMQAKGEDYVPTLEKKMRDDVKAQSARELLENSQFYDEVTGKVRERDTTKGIGSTGKTAAAGATAEQGAFFRPGAAIEKLDQWRQAITTRMAARPTRKIMDQLIDAGDTLANNAGRQSAKNVNIGITAIEDQAAAAIIAAKFDPANLPDLLTKAITGKHKKAQEAIQYAIDNYAAVEPTAQRGKVQFDEQLARENAAGMDTEYHEGYLPGIYDQDLWMGNGRPYVIGGKSGGISSSYKKGKTFESPFHALEDPKFKPKSLKLSDLVEHRVRVGEKAVNRIAWGDALREITDPTDGRAVVTSLEKKTRPSGTGYEVAPMGYTPREILPGVRVAIHEGYSSLFDALTGRSVIEHFEPGGLPIGKLALEGAGAIKHGLLLFDTFHASRIMQKQFFLTKEVGYKKGLSLLEYKDADLARAVKAGEITKEIADYAKANRPKAELIIRNGLNVGRIQEALYTSVARQIPLIGTFNKWVFEKMTRGAMMQAALLEFDRVKSGNPNLTDAQVAQKVARDLNAYFGNLGRQGIFKSSSFQDAARLVALAPQWVESMARSEVGGAKQLIADPIMQRRLAVGSLGRGMAGGLLAYFVGTQIINLVTRHQFTFQNDEPGHKLDAWIPDISGNTDGFWLSPFAVAAELTHDLIRYSHNTGEVLEAASRIASNKASPYWRAGQTLLSGENYKGDKFAGWDRIKESGKALMPVPIGASPWMNDPRPGQSRWPAAQRQALATVGVKTEPVVSQKIEHAIRLNRRVELLEPKLKKLPLSQRRSFAIQQLKDLPLSEREKALSKLSRQGVFTYR